MEQDTLEKGKIIIHNKEDSPGLDAFMKELQAIHSTEPKRVAIMGTRHISLTHQQVIELLAYALALGGNHIVTSGATGTNQAVIKGVMRANPGNLTVILPQTLEQQPLESREQLNTLPTLREHPERCFMTLAQASQMCNREIIEQCQQLLCFLYHTSITLAEALSDAKEQHKLVTAFYLD